MIRRRVARRLLWTQAVWHKGALTHVFALKIPLKYPFFILIESRIPAFQKTLKAKQAPKQNPGTRDAKRFNIIQIIIEKSTLILQL